MGHWYCSGIPARGTCTKISPRVPAMTRSPGALRNPKERFPCGVLKEEFGCMVFEKKSSMGDLTKVQSTPLASARGGQAWRQIVR